MKTTKITLLSIVAFGLSLSSLAYANSTHQGNRSGNQDCLQTSASQYDMGYRYRLSYDTSYAQDRNSSDVMGQGQCNRQRQGQGQVQGQGRRRGQGFGQGQGQGQGCGQGQRRGQGQGQRQRQRRGQGQGQGKCI
ncbi:MAG: hypothetical protein JEZ07_06140 [Phycisphaerae bacterium]|nr:hypothetical protein [Phycisphaerae bacterium]